MFWNFLVWTLFPVPTFLLVVLSLPLPQFAKSPVRRVILKITEVIFAKIPVGPIRVSLFHLAMALSSALLFVTTSKLTSKSYIGGEGIQQNPHCQRFRAERNFWISFLAFTMWLILGRFIAITREAEKYRNEVLRSESGKKDR